MKCDLLSLPDLVQAKKTQRDKDWPMIRRLVEAHYFANNAKSYPARIKFWLMELRTPELLLEIAQSHTLLAQRLAAKRPLLTQAALGELAQLEAALAAEEKSLREQDKAYWLPLRQELERLRHAK